MMERVNSAMINCKNFANVTVCPSTIIIIIIMIKENIMLSERRP
jgi:hypothetical protein